jgi:MFS family permease
VTQTLLLLLTVTLFSANSTGHLNPAALVGLATLSGLITSAHNPIRMSLAPRLVDTPAIGSVISILAISFNIARMTGPILGGWIIANWGISICLAVQILGYLPFIFALSLLRPRQSATHKSKAEPFLTALGTGVRYSLGDPVIRRAMLITAIVAFVIRGSLEIMPVVADGIFERGAAGLGLLTSAAGFGAVIAGMVRAASPGQSSERLPRWPLIIAIIGMTLIPVFGYSTSWPFTNAVVAWLGFSATTTAIATQTTIQIGLSDELRGRVMSLWTMTSMGMAAVGVFVLGVLTDKLGFAVTTGVIGCLGLALLLNVIRHEW